MNDYISRQDAIDALWEKREMLDSLMDEFLNKGMPIMRSNTKIERNRVENDIFIINQLPSAQLERKTGRWIPYEYGDERWHQCTACGVADKYIDYVKGYDGKTGKLVSVRHYCPNCGARMERDDSD